MKLILPSNRASFFSMELDLEGTFADRAYPILGSIGEQSLAVRPRNTILSRRVSVWRVLKARSMKIQPGIYTNRNWGHNAVIGGKVHIA
jgi:hypothetical protein